MPLSKGGDVHCRKLGKWKSVRVHVTTHFCFLWSLNMRREYPPHYFFSPQSPLFTMQSPMTFFRSLVLITIIASVTWMRAGKVDYLCLLIVGKIS